jgi:hypothetical protein
MPGEPCYSLSNETPHSAWSLAEQEPPFMTQPTKALVTNWAATIGFWMVVVLGSAPRLLGAQPEATKPDSHTTRNIEGWTVHVDDRLLGGPSAELGQRALRLLADRLYEITIEMQSDRLRRLQQVPIWLDRTHGKLTSMQYHPNPVWLSEHGYSTNLAKCVHIPDAALFASPRDHFRQPWAVLHELAHAYHDQVLGFDDPEIMAAWQRFREDRRYESVLQIDGRSERHYGLTDHKEYFAEMSEAYFGMNDFFPFNRAELKREEPLLFSLLLKIWGPLPSPITADESSAARSQRKEELRLPQK